MATLHGHQNQVITTEEQKGPRPSEHRAFYFLRRLLRWVGSRTDSILHAWGMEAGFKDDHSLQMVVRLLRGVGLTTVATQPHTFSSRRWVTRPGNDLGRSASS